MFVQDKAQRASEYLARQRGIAYEEISRIPADEIGKNIEALTNKYIEQFIVKPVELSKPVFKMNPDKPSNAEVTWKVSGNTELIGLADSVGNSIDLTKSSKTLIIQLLTYPGSIVENEQLQREIKQRVESLTAGLTSYINHLNKAVTEINKELRTDIPNFVAERVKHVNRTRAAEDFLNS